MVDVVCFKHFLKFSSLTLVIKAAKRGTKRSGCPTEFNDHEFEQEYRRRRSRYRRVDRQHVMRKDLVNRADYKPSWALNEAGRTLINASAQSIVIVVMVVIVGSCPYQRIVEAPLDGHGCTRCVSPSVDRGAHLTGTAARDA